MIVVTGADGQLGQELIKRLSKRKLSHKGYDINEWDITQVEQSRGILQETPGAVLINCAAYTAVDQAETEQEAAKVVNALVPELLAEICVKKGIRIIHLSTDFVFGEWPSGEQPAAAVAPWREDDSLSPVGVYARTKAEGERRAQAVYDAGNLSENLVIVRTSWLYSSLGNNFPKTILRLAADESRKELGVVDDQIGRPTWAGRLADFLLHLIYERGWIGDNSVNTSLNTKAMHPIYHFSNSGAASWYDLACAVVEMGAERGLLESVPVLRPIPGSAYPTAAKRPGFSVLDLSRAMALMPDIPHWRTDLGRFLDEVAAAQTTSAKQPV